MIQPIYVSRLSSWIVMAMMLIVLTISYLTLREGWTDDASANYIHFFFKSGTYVLVIELITRISRKVSVLIEKSPTPGSLRSWNSPLIQSLSAGLLPALFFFIHGEWLLLILGTIVLAGATSYHRSAEKNYRWFDWITSISFFVFCAQQLLPPNPNIIDLVLVVLCSVYVLIVIAITSFFPSLYDRIHSHVHLMSSFALTTLAGPL